MANFLNLDGAHNKTIILTTHTKNYDFFSLQVRQLAKHIKFPYVFVAGLDLEGSRQTGSLSDNEIINLFEKVSLASNTSLVQIPQIIHRDRAIIFPTGKFQSFGRQSQPANRCAESLQYVLSVVPWWQFNNLLVIDGDMFPIADIEAPLVSESSVFRGVLQTRKFFNRSIKYFWNGYFWIHNSCPFHHLVNFQNGLINKINTDVGGRTSYFLNALLRFDYPVSYVKHFPSGQWDESDLESLKIDETLKKFIKRDTRNSSSGRFYTELYDRVFFHYRAGGNWMNNNIFDEENRRHSLKQSLLAFE